MKNKNFNRLNIVIVADIDLSKLAGDTIRTLAFTTVLQKLKCKITLVIPKPSNKNWVMNLKGVNLIIVSIIRKDKSILNIFQRRLALIKKTKKLQKNNSIILIEQSVLGGYFALTGFSGFCLDVHGISFDEVNYVKLPPYVPKIFLRNFTRFLEKIAVKKASKIIVVSETMANFIINKWNIENSKIQVIPNGYFSNKVLEILQKGIVENKGMVTFVGYLAKWGIIEKIIRAAYYLKNEQVNFYIVGDGPKCYRQELEKQVQQFGINNVYFTGGVPLEKAYEFISRSEILLLPFPKTLCTEVASPIKVFEYMAFGKAMVIDEVTDISRLLKKNDGALVCNPKDEIQFNENIFRLINDINLRKQIGKNAKKLAKDFTWKKQVKKLNEILKNLKC